MIGAGAMDIEIRYLCRDRDRHGNERVYYRRNGRKIRIRSKPGSSKFLEEIAAARDAILKTEPRQTSKRGSLRWLVVKYYGECPAFKALAPSTQTVRRRILDDLCSGGGPKPYARLEPRHVKMWRNRKSATPAAANALVKALRHVFKWAVDVELAEADPTRDVPLLKFKSKGFHSWTTEEVRQYLDRHPLGTKAYLALAILLYTGVRRSDAVRLGRQHIKNGWHSFRDRKTGTRIEQPILPVLQQAIDASPTGDLAYLVTDYGKLFSPEGFGNRFRKWCDQAGIRHCSAHGLRKAGATIAAENGATAHQLMAIFGWSTLQQAELYTKAAERRRLAGEAMGLIDLEQNGDSTVPLPKRVAVPPNGTC